MNLKHIFFCLILFLFFSIAASAQQATKIEELDKHLGTSINILIGVVLIAIALPQILGYLERRERKELQKELQNQIHQLGERIERQQREIFEKLIQQQQEIETLKSRWIMTSS